MLLEATELESKDWWDEISDEMKASILQGEKEGEEGMVTPHEEVRKLYQKWL